MNITVDELLKNQEWQIIVYSHPELKINNKRVKKEILQSKNYQDTVKAIIIDEAHLTVEW